jgi:hypothetical protein
MQQAIRRWALVLVVRGVAFYLHEERRGAKWIPRFRVLLREPNR